MDLNTIEEIIQKKVGFDDTSIEKLKEDLRRGIANSFQEEIEGLAWITKSLSQKTGISIEKSEMAIMKALEGAIRKGDSDE